MQKDAEKIGAGLRQNLNLEIRKDCTSVCLEGGVEKELRSICYILYSTVNMSTKASASLTTDFSVFIVLTCKLSSVPVVVLFASARSSVDRLLCLALASLSLFSLRTGGLR